MIPKAKSHAKWNTLSTENKQLLEAWLFDEAVSYQTAWERARDQWQFSGSVSSIRRFFEFRARERTLADLTDSVAEARAINETPAQTAELKNAALKVIAQLLLKQVTQNPEKVSNLAAMARLLLRNEANENHTRLQDSRNAIRVAALELDRERFREAAILNALEFEEELLELERARKNIDLDHYQVNARLNAIRRSMFGDSVIPEPENAEEEKEQERKYQEWQKSVAPQTNGCQPPPIPIRPLRSLVNRSAFGDEPKTPAAPDEPKSPVTPPAP